MQTTARNATLSDLYDMLKDQHTRKVDLVAPAAKIVSVGGTLLVENAEPVITADGVTTTTGAYRPTVVADEGIAAKLGVPVGYLRRLRNERPDMYDQTVNGWLHGDSNDIPADRRSFLVRGMTADEGDTGIARAFLSDSYGIIDNIDALTATFDGIRQAGIPVEVDTCDLTDRRMYVRVSCPQIAALAPELLRGYRSPFTGESGDENPTMFAGLVISNSETGDGAFSITPRIIVQVCRNGMTISRDALRAVHLGAKMDEGVIKWSEDTQRKTLDLIVAKTRDAVATFLDTDYLRAKIAELTEQASKPIPGRVTDVVQSVGKKLAFGQEYTDGILDMFIAGGQQNVGGIVQAVTAYSQTIPDADAAVALEAAALRIHEVI